jgi:hypothetical protein
MSHSARVTSIETVERFRNSLCEFGKEVQDALCAVDMQIRRTVDWLADQAGHWQRQIKVRQEELTRAKIELTSRKYMNRDGKGPGSTDQEKAFRKAEARLKEAESKLANCRRWKPLLDHAIREYQGPARQLSAATDADLKHSLALLDQKLAALAAYLALNPPPAPSPVSMASSETGSDSEPAAAGIAIESPARGDRVSETDPQPDETQQQPAGLDRSDIR